MTAPLLLVLDKWFTWWHVLTTQRPLFWWNSASHLFLVFFFLLPLKKKQISVSILGSYYTYYEITTHTEQTAVMDMESVSQGAYIHGSASSSVMLQASNGGWNFLRILPSSHRKQQTNLVRTCWARSVMQQIAAHPYYSQTEQERVNQNSQHS